MSDKITVTLDKMVLRRILSAANYNLMNLKAMEGSQFPKSDADALKAIRRLQLDHPELL